MTARGCVHVVDDDAGMQASLVFLLETLGFSAKIYANAEALLAVLPTLGEGCILSDVRMPGLDGIALLGRIRALHRPLPVVIMTGHGDVPMAVEAMRLGAVDFIEKPFSDDTLLCALERAMAEGENAVDPARAAFKARIAGLSPRERQVFEGMVGGHANKVMARDLGISPRTVEIYRANVMAKTEAQSLSDLVRAAVKAGLA